MPDINERLEGNITMDALEGVEDRCANAIEMQNLTKNYKVFIGTLVRFPRLRSQVYQGKTSAGKSTTLKAICGCNAC